MPDNDKFAALLLLAIVLVAAMGITALTYINQNPRNQLICEDYIIFDDGQSIRLINCNYGDVHLDHKRDIFVDKNNVK